jgi:hypothetical protein
MTVEEVGLEERAVLRAIAGRSRAGSSDDSSNGPSLRVLDGGGASRASSPTDDDQPGNATLA